MTYQSSSKPSRQSRMADMAATMGFGSVIFPIAGLAALHGTDGFREFWPGCVGIAVLGSWSTWSLKRIQNEKTVYRRLVWTLCTVYFAAVLTWVVVVFDSRAFAAIVAIPEVLGLVLGLGGLAITLLGSNSNGAKAPPPKTEEAAQ